jgi:hypothetical protein
MYVLPVLADGTLNLQDASADTYLGDVLWDWTDTSDAVYSTTEPTDPAIGAKWVNNTNPVNPVLKQWNGHFWAGNAIDASSIYKSPKKDLYVGYLTGDGRPPNGAPYSFGISFPTTVVEGQFHLRTDYFPNRLFRYTGTHWARYEDNVRMTLTNSYDVNTVNDPTKPTDAVSMRQTQRMGFINNNNTATIAGEVVQERQALSKALKPRADN